MAKKEMKFIFQGFVIGNKYYPPEAPPDTLREDCANAIISVCEKKPMPPLKSTVSVKGKLICDRCKTKRVANVISEVDGSMICIECAIEEYKTMQQNG